MRGDDNQQEGIFSYISPEKRVPADHPLRPIRKMVDEILKEMSPQFAKLYSDDRGQWQSGARCRDAAMLMAETIPGGKRVTLSGDKNYDTQELVRELRGMNIVA